MATWRSIEQGLAAGLQRDEASLRVGYNDLIGQSFSEIEQEIAAFYAKYGTDGVLAYRDMIGRLSPEDYAMLYQDMNAFALKFPEYANMLPLSTSIYQLDRLEALKAQILMVQGNLSNQEAAVLEAHMARWGTNYANGALTSALTTAGAGIAAGVGMYHVNNSLIHTALMNPWSGESFSSRIWKNNQKVGEWLNTEFVIGVSRGDSYDRLIKSLKAVYGNVSRQDMYRLIYTEGTYITNETSAQSFEEEFEEYILSPVHDAKTCPVCLGVEAAQIKTPATFNNRVQGENFPPLHPWCRCSFIVHVSDWDTWLDERTGRTDTNPKNTKAQADLKAKQLVNKATTEGKQVTPDMMAAAKASNGEMEGLAFRTKSQGSLSRKMQKEAIEEGISIDAASKEMRDVLRYTCKLPEANFTQGFTDMRTVLERQGYQFVKVKNTWYDGSSYKGINCNLATSDGYVFELQFHTEQSLQVKEINHLLYEEARLVETPVKRKEELDRMMLDNALSIVNPSGIETIK